MRLQIELDRLKEGEQSRYRHELIRDVPRLHVTPAGCLAPIGEAYVVDIHHEAHPFSRSNGTNHLSIGFTGHYETMRERFGAHVSLGVAGENVIVERPGLTTVSDLGSELLFEFADGSTLHVARPQVMRPCAPFTRFGLGDPEPPAQALRTGLQFLDAGMRGFKGMPEGSAMLTVGAQLHARAD